jgi:hypothetical protein
MNLSPVHSIGGYRNAMLPRNASPECSTERSPPLLLRKNVTKGLHSFQAQMISADYAKYS